jgi:glutathione peroxidase
MKRAMMVLASLLCATMALAGVRDASFASIDGGKLEMSDWAGQPVLVVNTASRCGYTGQYAGLQALYDRYRDRGLVVLAVPSDDFNQELDSAEAVREFCELTYGIDMPMADITRVKGAGAHPFYRAVRDATGFEPRWNFNKVLIAPDGSVAGSWGSRTEPLSPPITGAVEALLGAS